MKYIDGETPSVHKKQMKKNTKQAKRGDNPEIILCKKTKKFENIIVCTYQCLKRCEEYKQQFDIELIKKYLELHPEYEMKGVIMSSSEKTMPTNQSKEKIYWIISGDNQYTEVTESEIINNPADYIGKPMFEKPKDQFEIVVTIRRKVK